MFCLGVLFCLDRYFDLFTMCDGARVYADVSLPRGCPMPPTRFCFGALICLGMLFCLSILFCLGVLFYVDMCENVSLSSV